MLGGARSRAVGCRPSHGSMVDLIFGQMPTGDLLARWGSEALSGQNAGAPNDPSRSFASTLRSPCFNYWPSRFRQDASTGRRSCYCVSNSSLAASDEEVTCVLRSPSASTRRAFLAAGPLKLKPREKETRLPARNSIHSSSGLNWEKWTKTWSGHSAQLMKANESCIVATTPE